MLYWEPIVSITWAEGMYLFLLILSMTSQRAKFMGPTWGPPGSYRPQKDPMSAPWTLLSGICFNSHWLSMGFMGPALGPPGDDRTQVGPMLAPWTLLSGSSISLPIWFLSGCVFQIVASSHSVSCLYGSHESWNTAALIGYVWWKYNQLVIADTIILVTLASLQSRCSSFKAV